MGEWLRTIGQWLAACGLLAGSAAVSAQDLPPALANAWRTTGLPVDSLSLVVQEIGGQRLVALNARQPRNPASVMKLLTTWAALSELGPDYTWHTDFLVDPGVRPNARGVLHGSLYLRAGGDPQFSLQDMWILLRELRLRGIKQIGDLIIDRSIFGDVTIDPGAFDNAPDRAYNASPNALMVSFGALRLLFIPDPAAGKWKSIIDPPLPGLKIEGELEWADGNCSETAEVSTDPVITPQGVSIRVGGQMAGACGEFSLNRLALPQDAYATAVFRLLWRELGGVFKGTVRAGTVPPDAVLLARHSSPMLGETIREINKRSNNVMARTLLLTLGAEGGARPATVSGSAPIVIDILRRQGLNAPELIIENGSGLSRGGRVSADSIVSLLSLAWDSPYMPEFVASLGIPGLDGTQLRRVNNPVLRGMAHVKTGGLRDVRSIAGYVQGAGGKRYVVASIVNHEQPESVSAFHEALIEWLVKR